RCTLARTFPLPSAPELEKIYDPSYYFFRAPTEAPRLGERVIRSFKRVTMRFGLHALYPYAFTPRAPKGSLPVLDFGCGAGRFVELVKHARPAWSVYGVEPFPEAA